MPRWGVALFLAYSQGVTLGYELVGLAARCSDKCGDNPKNKEDYEKAPPDMGRALSVVMSQSSKGFQYFNFNYLLSTLFFILYSLFFIL